MNNRARTRFRELNEVRNALEQKSAVKQFLADYSYVLIMAVQQVVDISIKEFAKKARGRAWGEGCRVRVL